VTEMTLAAARDSIRILSWLKSHAPQTRVFVVANRVHPNQLEISRKDFEGSIERRIDWLVPFDQKLAAQAAKLGKPFAEAGKNAKTVAPLVELADALAACVTVETDDKTGKTGAKNGGGKTGGGKGAAAPAAKGKSLIAGLLARRSGKDK